MLHSDRHLKKLRPAVHRASRVTLVSFCGIFGCYCGSRFLRNLAALSSPTESFCRRFDAATFGRAQSRGVQTPGKLCEFSTSSANFTNISIKHSFSYSSKFWPKVWVSKAARRSAFCRSQEMLPNDSTFKNRFRCSWERALQYWCHFSIS